jgi:ferredoxin
MRRRHLSILRWCVQLISFAVLIYGGFGMRALDRWLADPVLSGGSGPGPTSVKPVFKRDTRTQLYLPVTACIYQRQGLCKGCSLYFTTDIITWQKPVEEYLGLLVVLLVVLLAAGRLWCGWVCPLGLTSDVLSQLRVWLGLAQRRLSLRVRNALVWTKYILLTLSLCISAFGAYWPSAGDRMSWVDPFCQVCPSRIIEAFFTFDDLCWLNDYDSITLVFSGVGFVAFGMFFLGFFVRRLWCRLCPIGGLSALFNRTGLIMLVKDAKKCTRCGACQRTCPVDVQRVYQGRGLGPVTSYECQLCLRCVERCPEEGCLQFRWLGGKVSES